MKRMHFYESSIITTTDGLYCLVYSNEHPDGRILVKPKYIPTDKIASDSLSYRFISGRKMNRLDLWIDKAKLRKYVNNFIKAYPDYVFQSPVHQDSPLFFSIPREKIERVYLPKEGLAELMSMPDECLDDHLKKVVDLASFFLKSGLLLPDLGITYSTLMGHYCPNMSDINVVVYGKEKFWRLMDFLEKNNHPDLKWKSYEDWEHFYTKRNRHIVHDKEIYIKNMYRKKSEGFFRNTLFVVFAVENEGETWFRWGEERYRKIGTAKFEGLVEDSNSSSVRPGCYTLSQSKFLGGNRSCRNLPISKVVFYSRDYCLLAYPNEEIEISGVVEEVTPQKGEKYYRMVVGYFDSYLDKRREDEYIRVIKDYNE